MYGMLLTMSLAVSSQSGIQVVQSSTERPGIEDIPGFRSSLKMPRLENTEIQIRLASLAAHIVSLIHILAGNADVNSKLLH